MNIRVNMNRVVWVSLVALAALCLTITVVVVVLLAQANENTRLSRDNEAMCRRALDKSEAKREQYEEWMGLAVQMRGGGIGPVQKKIKETLDKK